MAFAYLQDADLESDDLDSEIVDNYFGSFSSDDDFVEEYLEQFVDMKGIPDIIKHHLDYEAILRDLECSGEFNIVEYNGSLFVWLNH